jgi:hypothetical protein
VREVPGTGGYRGCRRCGWWRLRGAGRPGRRWTVLMDPLKRQHTLCGLSAGSRNNHLNNLREAPGGRMTDARKTVLPYRLTYLIGSCVGGLPFCPNHSNYREAVAELLSSGICYWLLRRTVIDEACKIPVLAYTVY